MSLFSSLTESIRSPPESQSPLATVASEPKSSGLFGDVTNQFQEIQSQPSSGMPVDMTGRLTQLAGESNPQARSDNPLISALHGTLDAFGAGGNKFMDTVRPDSPWEGMF